MESSHHYYRLVTMAVLSFVAMYVLMYSMVDTMSHVYMSLNQVYMAALMTAPMVVIELLLMGMMYQKKLWNGAIVVAAVVLGIVCFLFIRQQTGIDDKQFLRSMIPHHSGAILMCEQASLQDLEIKELCEGIVAGQQAEIDQMANILKRL